jgi:interferon-induced GTP-binding protein Mx1
MILDEKIMGALVGQMQEQCYVFVHDKDRLSSFFEEDADLVKRRNDLTRKRDRLSKANAAMANIQVDANLRGGPRAVRLTIALGSAGLGLQLADENDKLVVRGYRDMPDGVVNPGFESGVEVGDVIDQVNGQQASTFQEGINLLKALPASTVATITLLRTKKKS